MTAFKTSIGSVLSKALYAGLVAAAIFATPIHGRESHMINRHIEQSVEPDLSRSEGNWWVIASAPSGPVTTPSYQPGGVCDAGGNPASAENMGRRLQQ
ncbi:hypothetical protein [Bradyrhizobium sp. STM 3557]|uniref:hypothetical protein n=1 Tax=Bradyrhizobium sp. STM 3557 TaxID=578920 RepID=UPI0038910279